MKRKEIIITTLITLIITLIYGVNYFYDKVSTEKAKSAYLVYLDGKNLGLIENKDSLYKLINKEQEAIRLEYNVNDVYPPADFNIVKVNTFENNYKSVNEIYNSIASVDDFTIEGYIITIKPKEENKENIVINVLDKNVFLEAMNKFILSFITEDELENYLAGNRSITDIGSIISNMYFDEVITIKKGYVSVKDKIYTDVDSLSQYLLFGPDAKIESYEVALGDNIEKISEQFKINPQEFIIANPSYRDSSALLTVGSKVNITIINPVVNFIYEVDQISENVTPFITKQVTDESKDYGYKKITTPGVDGIALDHAFYQVINGEASSEIRVVDEDRVVIREMVPQIVTVGSRYSAHGSQVSSGGNWAYPTNYPYYVTSPYGWRKGSMHRGLDISGTGFGSPIYAVDDATVVEVSSRSKDGNFIILDHGNNIYTQYAHLEKALVSVGQKVKQGDRIALMGHSGLATGTHLHFGVCIGYPYHGTDYEFQDPRKYINF